MEASIIPVLAAFAVAGVVAAAVVAAVVIVGALYARRRYLRLRRNFGVIAFTHAMRIASGIRPTPTALRAARSRFALARSVGAAEHAVQMARAAGAPLGDLPSLCGQVRAEAARLDYGLRIAQRAASPSPQMLGVIEQANRLAATAASIQESAAAAVSGMSSQSAGRLGGNVEMEAEATRAGIGALDRVG